MKRTFRHEICFAKGESHVYLYDKGEFVTIEHHLFRAIVGTGFGPKHTGRLAIRLRLIGEPLPWDDWEWGTGVYTRNRFVIEVFGNHRVYVNVFSLNLNDRRDIMQICVTEANLMFPGLAKAIGRGNTCEVEITAKLIK